MHEKLLLGVRNCARSSEDFMTAIEQAIKEAVEKGGCSLRKANSRPNSEILLDSQFWQALGKAREWEDGKFHVCARCNMLDEGQEIAGWMLHWHHFIHHLAEGKDAESFFASL